LHRLYLFWSCKNLLSFRWLLDVIEELQIMVGLLSALCFIFGLVRSSENEVCSYNLVAFANWHKIHTTVLCLLFRQIKSYFILGLRTTKQTKILSKKTSTFLVVLLGHPSSEFALYRRNTL